MGKLSYAIGMLKNLLNPHVSALAFVSVNTGLDKTATVYRAVKIRSSKIGAYSYVGPASEIENAEIGKFCSIADHCRIGSGTHNLDQISTSPIFTQRVNGTRYCWVDHNVNDAPLLKVKLGNDVWVGSRAMILGGVTVGDGAVIGAGAVVVKDVPPYAVVGGVPAKVIRYRFSAETIARLRELVWWEYPESVLKKHISFFQRRNFSETDIISMMGLFKSSIEGGGNSNQR